MKIWDSVYISFHKNSSNTHTKLRKMVTVLEIYLILSKLVLDHTSVSSSIFFDNPGDLEGSIWQLSDSVILGDGLTPHLPVKLRAWVSDGDAGEFDVLLGHGCEDVVEGGNLGWGSGSWRQSHLLRCSTLSDRCVCGYPEFVSAN